MLCLASIIQCTFLRHNQPVNETKSIKSDAIGRKKKKKDYFWKDLRLSPSSDNQCPALCAQKSLITLNGKSISLQHSSDVGVQNRKDM